MKKLIVIVFVSIALYFSVFVVKQHERGLVLRFTKVLRDGNNNPIVYAPGLHFKVPFIDQVKRLDARIQTMDNKADRFVTIEKKDLIIDSYLKWRISDFSRFYLSTGGGDISKAELLLKRKLSDRLRSIIGTKDIQNIVTDSRGQLMIDVRDALNAGSQPDMLVINENKDEIANIEVISEPLQNDLNAINANSVSALGIEVIDVRIKQINLPDEVYDAIFTRMRAEREAVARRHRSQGLEQAEKLRAATDLKVTRTIAEAERQARIIRGEGDAEAAKLFANAFSQHPDFYSFIRSLQAYENSFKSGNDVMLLQQDSGFFRYMKPPSKNN